MTDILMRSDFDVDLIQSMGDDAMVCHAARVSTRGGTLVESIDESVEKGLINFLMGNRHGSPFEHTAMTFRITAPIFVWREFMRHRIASYNEESGRYKKLDPVFYMPPAERPLKQVGKPGAYEFVPGDSLDTGSVQGVLRSSAITEYRRYEAMLAQGIAREVARMLLPVNIYSTAYVTMNARGLMNFLSLRTKREAAAFKSFPQWEIAQVAELMEMLFHDRFPLTAAAFDKNGRVCP